MLRRLFSLLAVVGSVFGSTGLLLYYWLVILDPGEQIRQGNIEKILSVETEVYYSGGQEKVGVFFEEAHRQYLPYSQIPKDFVNSLIASEDEKFFSHHGFDFLGVVRAMAANLLAGRVVQGGSTITQQTAKNLFRRKNRSLGSKLEELLFALRLEYHYPKEKILEFYANQFYVSGTGLGLGVASRYYFDKEASQLTLPECAFIAGSVKRPNYYNPFTKLDEGERKAALERSRARVNYVLGQMYRNGLISGAEYERNLDKPVPFRQGKTFFSLNTVMDLVREALAEPGIEAALREHGIDNVSTSGLRIYTSVEKGVQEEGQRVLRRELSRLDTRLRGYERDEVQREYQLLTRDDGLRDFAPGTFHFGRVKEVVAGFAPKVVVAMVGAPEGEYQSFIDDKGLMNLLAPLVKFERQAWAEASRTDIQYLLPRLRVGDLIYVSVREVGLDGKALLLDMERYPRLQGGVLATRDGMIRAMVGGMDNSFYNRAITARRPMGSVVKPLVYTAALQLGWSNLDVLNNERDFFIYQGQPYFPRPDHKSPFKEISMTWAGVNSENVATVWLLYHLCDRMTPAQFREVVDHLGLGPMAGEAEGAYQQRIRDGYGVQVNDTTVREVAFARAVAELEPDLVFAGRLADYETISKLHYGTNFAHYLKRVDIDLGLEGEDGAEVEETAGRDPDFYNKDKESGLRKSLLRRGYLRLGRLRTGLDELRRRVEAEPDGGKEGTGLYQNRQSGRYLYAGWAGHSAPAAEAEADEDDDVAPVQPAPAAEGWRSLSGRELAETLAALDPARKEAFWGGVLLDNTLAAETVDLLSEAVNREYAKLKDLSPYSPEVLFQTRDFRVMVGLHYIIGLCRAMGVESRLDPVLSFPLGSNVMSLLEVARVYEAMLTGSIKYNGDGRHPGLAIIEAIEAGDGEEIYRAERSEKKVVAPETALVLGDILRQVVKFGTGHYADEKVRLRSRDPLLNRQLGGEGPRVPVVGKTGTANRYINAAFAGGVPGLLPNGLFALSEGYVLTAYVGFDDNSPMALGSTRISGAMGALPAWSGVANQIILDNDYAAKVDLEDLAFAGGAELPLAHPELGQAQVRVDPERGGLAGVGEGGRAVLLSFGDFAAGERPKPARLFKPYWQMEEE